MGEVGDTAKGDVAEVFARLTGAGGEPVLPGAVTAIVAVLSAIAGAPPSRVPDGELLDALVLLHWAQAELAVAEHTLIDSARRAGISWQAIAPAVGVASRQAAERRFLRLAPSKTETGGPVTGDEDPPPTTRDGRVRAERDRRAGQRAVARWANDNTSDLRRLAGQITAITDLDRTADADIDRLHHALSDTDAVALPQLLANTRQHLADHPDLTDQIDAVTARTVEVRDDTQRSRDRLDD